MIKGIDIEIKAGEFKVSVGPSGRSKSTWLRLISGLEAITTGEMAVDTAKVNSLVPFGRLNWPTAPPCC